MIPVMKQEPHPYHKDGIQRTYQFKTCKISAIKTDFSYGGKSGLWEIAVLDDAGQFITRDIWIGLDDDVIGHVSDDKLVTYLEDVSAYEESKDGLET